ncbi:MAG: HAD family hydrolase [Candidatus Micrarchaeota archaeon]
MKLAVFDLDDTLLHLRVSWPEVRREVVALARGKGLAADESEHLVPLGNRLASVPEIKAGIDAIYLKYETACMEGREYTVYPEMVALVRSLRAGGLRLAIASGNHTSVIRKILSDIGLIREFDVVLGRDTVANNKPHPDQLIRIMDALGAKPEETVFIGDSIYDAGAAAAAGVKFIKVHKGPGKDVAALKEALA